MNCIKLFRFFLSITLITLLVSCAMPKKSGLDLEMENMFKSGSTEMIWIDQAWENEEWEGYYIGPKYNSILTEFVRPPETVHNWTELLSLEIILKTSKIYKGQFYSFTTVPDPLEGVEMFKKAIQSRCTNQITFKKLGEDRSNPYPSVRFYAACDKFLNGSSPEAQVHQVTQGKSALYHIHRIRRATTLDDDTIEYWEKGLSLFKVCDDNIPEQKCDRKTLKKVTHKTPN